MDRRIDGRTERGRLVVSFDLELAWGTPTPDEVSFERIRTARRSLPKLLGLLDELKIPATWATTMALSHSGPDAVREFLEQEGELELWRTLERSVPGLRSAPDCYFAPEFFAELAQEDDQELACHTYSHALWTSGGSAVLARELRLSQRIAEIWQKTLHTLVFPRNRYSSQALEVLQAHGLSGFRSDVFVSSDEELGPIRVAFGRARRFVDAFAFSVRGSRSPVEVVRPGLVSIAGQRFLRLDDPSWLLQEHIRRVERELLNVALRGEHFHIWTHPENLAKDPTRALDALRRIFTLANELRERGLLEVVTMADVARGALCGDKEAPGPAPRV